MDADGNVMDPAFLYDAPMVALAKSPPEAEAVCPSVGVGSRPGGEGNSWEVSGVMAAGLWSLQKKPRSFSKSLGIFLKKIQARRDFSLRDSPILKRMLMYPLH